MHEGIFRIQAEVCITAASEEDARKFAKQQRISQKMCRWSKDFQGRSGRLYVGGEMFFDVRNNSLTFEKPPATTHSKPKPYACTGAQIAASTHTSKPKRSPKSAAPMQEQTTDD